MGKGNDTEKKGIIALTKKLLTLGRIVKPSDNKTFDLIVDGQYAEVKTKEKPYAKIDFIPFTNNQFNEINKNSFIVFLVCNLQNPNDIEIYEFQSNLLKQITSKQYTSYEYNKGEIDKISNKIIKL